MSSRSRVTPFTGLTKKTAELLMKVIKRKKQARASEDRVGRGEGRATYGRTAGGQISNSGNAISRWRVRAATSKVALTKRLFPHPALIPELNHSRVRERAARARLFMQMNSSARARACANVARDILLVRSNGGMKFSSENSDGMLHRARCSTMSNLSR